LSSQTRILKKTGIYSFPV